MKLIPYILPEDNTAPNFSHIVSQYDYVGLMILRMGPATRMDSMLMPEIQKLEQYIIREYHLYYLSCFEPLDLPSLHMYMQSEREAGADTKRWIISM